MLLVSLTYIPKYTKYQRHTQDLRTKCHVIYSLHLHLVFVTKYREKIFTEKMYERLHFHYERVCGEFGRKLVNSLKGVSSRSAYASPDGVLRQEFTELEKYYWKRGLWSPSYFIVSCGGAPLDVVKKYIENQ